MLTGTPASNGAPADSAARPTGAPLSVALAAPGLRGMRSAARPEGRGDADRGPLQALNPTSGGDSRRRSPVSNEGLAVCVSFRQLSVLLIETQQFSTASRAREGLRRCGSTSAGFFGLKNAEWSICGGNVSRGAALVTPGSYRDGALASFVDQNVAVHVQRQRLLRVSELRRQVGDRHPLAQFHARVAMA